MGFEYTEKNRKLTSLTAKCLRPISIANAFVFQSYVCDPGNITLRERLLFWYCCIAGKKNYFM